jgi:hypothetical protein
VTCDDGLVVFSVRAWNSPEESWNDYMCAVERGYSQYLDRWRRTITTDQTGQDREPEDLDPADEGQERPDWSSRVVVASSLAMAPGSIALRPCPNDLGSYATSSRPVAISHLQDSCGELVRPIRPASPYGTRGKEERDVAAARLVSDHAVPLVPGFRTRFCCRRGVALGRDLPAIPGPLLRLLRLWLSGTRAG